MAFILKAGGVVSDYGAKLLHMEAVTTHRAPDKSFASFDSNHRINLQGRLSDGPASLLKPSTTAVLRHLS